jgi:6,7-dimethyl-8-ribityllumazine synthase
MISKHTNTYDVPIFEKEPKICLVAAIYYKEITEHLMSGCLDMLKNVNARVDTVKVSGALEIPTAIKLLEKKYDGFVAIGCVIRGDTTHYEIVSNESSRSISNLGLQGFCIGNCILTVENEKQAKERAEPTKGNKGAQASLAMLQLLKIKLSG